MFTWFYDERKIYIALELASEGELYRHLKAAPHGRFDEHRAAKYTYQVADALNYCHLNNVIHRDLKPENLLLTGDDNIKLGMRFTGPYEILWSITLFNPHFYIHS